MKPSERIKEIMIDLSKKTGKDPFEHKIGAIWEYLDEEWEKKQFKNQNLVQVPGNTLGRITDSLTQKNDKQ